MGKEIALITILGLFIPIAGSSEGQLELATRVLTHVAMITIVLAWLGYKLARRERMPATPLDIPIVLLLLVTLTSTVFSVDARLSLEGLLLVPFYALFFYLVADLLQHGWPDVLFVRALIIATAIVCVLPIQEALEWYLRWYEIGGSAHPIPLVPFRISTSVGGPNNLAAHINLVVPLALALMVLVPQRRARVLLAGWLLLVFSVELLTLSRGGLLGATGGVMITTILLALSLRRQGRLAIFADWCRSHKPFAALAVCALSLTIVSAATISFRFLTNPSRRGSNQIRLGYWSAAATVLKERPLTGAGYLTYATQYQRFASIPPMPPTSKAHNAILTIGAEFGLLGLAASAALSGTLFAALRTVWERSSGRRQLLIAGCVGSLGGFLIHSMVDDFVHLPLFVFEQCLIVAVLLTPDGTSRTTISSVVPVRSGVRVRTVIVPFLLVAAVLLWTDVPYFCMVRGAIMGTQARWEKATYWVNKATELDPFFGFYHFQLGFAYGHLAASQPQLYLQRAIAEYERGFTHESSYSLNHANAAALYWQRGSREAALQAIHRAIELAPAASSHRVQLGSYYEEMGRHSQAESQYEEALQLDTTLAEDTFWGRTDLRQGFIARWRNDRAMPSAHWEARRAQAYVQRGWDAFYEGECEEAIYHFRVAMLLGGFVEGQAALGRLAREQGNIAEAIGHYEAAVTTVLEPDSYGRFVYRRIGFYDSTLPQLPDLGFTRAMAESYLELGALYEETGELDRARRAYELVAEHDPTFQPPLGRLESLKHGGQNATTAMSTDAHSSVLSTGS
jgi:tetratricopeptide (TPR) repeat protein/O-antigen ligase